MGVKHVIGIFANDDSTRFKNVKLRLSEPVFAEETVKTEMWSEAGGQRIVHRQLVGDERVVIT